MWQSEHRCQAAENALASYLSPRVFYLPRPVKVGLFPLLSSEMSTGGGRGCSVVGEHWLPFQSPRVPSQHTQGGSPQVSNVCQQQLTFSMSSVSVGAGPSQFDQIESSDFKVTYFEYSVFNPVMSIHSFMVQVMAYKEITNVNSCKS